MLQEQLVDGGAADVPSTSQKQQHKKIELIPLTNTTVAKIVDIDDGDMDSVSKDGKLSAISGYKLIHSSILQEMLCFI